jgi:hypothetical protein
LAAAELLLLYPGQPNAYVAQPPGVRAAWAAAADPNLATDFPGLLEWRDWLCATHWVPESDGGSDGAVSNGTILASGDGVTSGSRGG